MNYINTNILPFLNDLNRIKERTNTDILDSLISKLNTKKLTSFVFLTIDRIKHEVLKYFNLEEEELFKKTRKIDILLPRQIIHYLCVNYYLGSLETIGKKIGNKGHATVLHSCKRINEYYETDDPYYDYVENINNILIRKYNMKNKPRYR